MKLFNLFAGARLYRIKESNARYAAREGYRIFRHCALPRTGAAHAAIEITTGTDCGDYMESIYFRILFSFLLYNRSFSESYFFSNHSKYQQFPRIHC